MHRARHTSTERPPCTQASHAAGRAHAPSRPRRAPQLTCECFREEFNCQRPHEALDRRTPAACDEPSPRKMPNKLPPLEYPDRFAVCYVSAHGGVPWNRQWANVSHVCVGEYIGLEEIDDGVWHVYFGPPNRGRFLDRYLRIEDAYGRLKRRR
jgi:putative transposase